ncbi:MAG: glucose 1-dehydrogenase [Spirochaetaceae bacterium]|nr:glucose 1-dehydrogenase [Spirochaetaceae bacterium]
MQYPDFSLNDKIAVVTGASKGIGYELARAFANAGATVAVLARTESPLISLVDEITADGGKATPYVVDLRNTGAIPAVFDEIEADLGPVDVLVNNAGVGNPLLSIEVDESYWDDMMSLNLKSVFFCSQAAARSMLNRGQGRIVNMSSQAGVAALPEAAVYCASKGGVNMLTKALALEWGPEGINVNAVGPTFVHTPGTAERLDDPDFSRTILQQIPLGRVATISDVAAAVIYLSSPAGSMVNGELILVDGGWTIH